MSDRMKALVGFGPGHAGPARPARMLRRVGFQPTDDWAACAEVAGDEAIARDSRQSAAEGAATGASAGAVVGAVLGWLAGIGTLGVLGTDAVIAVGPILAAGAGAGVAGALGGLLGGLVGLGMHKRQGASG
jgi:hypothetical protein